MNLISPETMEHPMVTDARKRGFVPGAVHNGAWRGGFYLIDLFVDDGEPYYDDKFDQVMMSGVAVYSKGQWAQIWNKKLQKFEDATK